MVGPLLINLAVAIVMLALSASRSTDHGHPAQFYPATIPTMVQAGLAALAALVGLGFRRLRLAGVLVSAVLIGSLGAPAAYALQEWPHGDDCALGWLFIVGGGCVLSLFAAIVTAVLGLASRAEQHPDRVPGVFAPVGSDEGSSPATGVQPPSAFEPQTLHAPRRPRRRHRWLYAVLALPVLGLLTIAIGPISWNVTRIEQYGGGVVVQHIDQHEVIPYLMFFHQVRADHEQVLLVNGREALRERDYKRLYPSPDGAYVLAQHWLHTGPMRIYRTADMYCIELPVDDSKSEFPGHYYVYPFDFLRWEDEGHFLVVVRGSRFDPTDRSYGPYEQVWRIAADTGARERVE